MTSKLLVLSLFLLLNPCLFMSAQQTKPGDKANRAFLKSSIRFDNSSLKSIVLNPEAILADPDAFWKNDSAYKLYALWHQLVSYPVDMEQWKKDLQAYVDVPTPERQKNSQLLLSQSMLNKEKADHFNERAIPYLYSFLPKDCPPADATIYFTTAILPNGFQMGTDVVIYGENADKENLLIHELFHRCQRACETLSDIKESRAPEWDQVYFLLWIEGTATYVAYKGLAEFPSVDPLLQRDYKLLADTMNIIQLRHKLNELFSRIATNSIEKNELPGILIQTGVVERAFYIVGFDMASTIDAELGREALKETVLCGPEFFIKTYNSLVNDHRKIVDLYPR